MELVHPNRPETWRNNPPPYLAPRFTQALEEIGGRTVDGRPYLRWAWGQTRTQFRRGKERLLYIDERIPPIRHTRHVLKRPLLFLNGKNAWERRTLSEIPQVIPPGWFYEQELASIEWIGQQLWFIEQLYLPEVSMPNGEVFMPFGTPEDWEAIRYEDWDDPEIGPVSHCDVLGPFPREGRYTAIMLVGQPFSWVATEEEVVLSWIDEHGRPFKDDNGKPMQRAVGNQLTKRLEHGVCYREPEEDTLEQLRRGWQEREHRHIESAKQRGKNKFYEDELRRREAKEQRLKAAREYMAEEKWRWSSPDSGPTGGVGGGARVYLSEKDGKGEKE